MSEYKKEEIGRTVLAYKDEKASTIEKSSLWSKADDHSTHSPIFPRRKERLR